MDRVKAFFQAVRSYLLEVVSELKKVVWPTKERTFKLTGVVVGMVALIAVYLFAFDAIFSFGAQKFLGR